MTRTGSAHGVADKRQVKGSGLGWVQLGDMCLKGFGMKQSIDCVAPSVR